MAVVNAYVMGSLISPVHVAVGWQYSIRIWNVDMLGRLGPP